MVQLLCVCVFGGGQLAESWGLANDSSCRCAKNGLLLNTNKTEGKVIDFCRSKLRPQQVGISGVDIEVVQSYWCLGVHLHCNFDWSVNSEARS